MKEIIKITVVLTEGDLILLGVSILLAYAIYKWG